MKLFYLYFKSLVKDILISFYFYLKSLIKEIFSKDTLDLLIYHILFIFSLVFADYLIRLFN